MKRHFDLIVAALGLLILAPILLLLIFLVRFKLGSPVFFKQIRPGLQGMPFVMIKFRTMSELRDSDGVLLDDAERLTPFGRLLRSTSLDELPELWNVIRGDMSIVGPRPLLTRYLPYFTELEKKRFTVRPGITGWAQINGRNLSRWDDRLSLDVWYVENQSFFLDLKIIAKTVGTVLQRDGVEVDPSAVMLNLDQERKVASR